MAIGLNVTKSYSYTGSAQTESLAIGVYEAILYGGAGAVGYLNGTQSAGVPGKGGKAVAQIKLTSAGNMAIYVGGKAVAGKGSSKGGWNGGGSTTDDSDKDDAGGGGGGATDLRWGGTALSNRILVAGGGGGAGCNGGNGGDGGGSSGGYGKTSNGSNGANPGTQTSGHALGVGKDGHLNGGVSGAGGGGYYGGQSSSSSYATGGGGGSGYANTTYCITNTLSTSTHNDNGTASLKTLALVPTISVKSKNTTQIVLTLHYNSVMSTTKTLRVQRHGTWSQVHSTTSSVTAAQDITYSVPANTYGKLTFEVNNGHFTKTLTLNYDNKPPVITFPSESYASVWNVNEGREGFIGTDETDKTLDYEVQLYLNDVMFHSYTTTDTYVTPPHALVESADEGNGTFYIKVRAKQSADTTGIGQDIWSEWYTSPSVAFKDNVITYPNFNRIKWYQDVEQQAIVCDYHQGVFETKHYCNGELYTTTQHPLGLTPPLLYTPIKPHLWSYEYYAVTRVQVNGKWSGWYKSPTVEVQFNVQPNDIEFSKGLPPYFIQGEVITIEWKESTDPNATKTTYTVSLMNNTTEELFEVRDIEEPRLTFTVPDDVVSNNITVSVVAYSDGLYSNPVSSPNMAITDVKIMDCNLDFPVLNTNVTGQVTEFILEINGDRRISKAENFTDYTIPLHYFRKGENKLTLIAKDRNGVEVTRTWKVNLDFNNTNLIPLEGVEVEGYMSFNHNEVEQYVPCTTLFKPNLDLGVVEHELYGSTTFEGVNSITQKLVIRRESNDDNTQLRTLKITGAIE